MASAVTLAFSFVASFIIATVIDKVIGLRVSEEDEDEGLDFSQHAETAYAEGVHGHLPSRRPGTLGDLGAPRREAADEN